MAPEAGHAAASRALDRGRPLEALTLVATRNDAHSLALRGIALSQLGDWDRAAVSLSEALRRFRRARTPLWIAKAQAALAEIAFARRDLPGALRHLNSRVLRTLGDAASAAYIDLQRCRLLGMLGRDEEAEALLKDVNWGPAAILARAELLTRRGEFASATRVLSRMDPRNPLLAGEADRLRETLNRPTLRYIESGSERMISLVQLEQLRRPYVDLVRRRLGKIDLSRRPEQLRLLAALARGPVTSKKMYGFANESLLMRLKMEISRLRRLAEIEIESTPRGFVTAPLGVLIGAGEPIEALLSDGESWPPGSVAAVLGCSVRSVERALCDPTRFVPQGRGRNRRYRLRRSVPGIATHLLLLARNRNR